MRPHQKYELMKELAMNISTLSDIAQVSKSGYYKWLKTICRPDKDYKDYLIIKEVFDKGKGKYGWRTIQMNLEISMNHKKIQRIMRRYGLICKIRRRNPYIHMMKKTAEHRTFENILDRNFNQNIPRKVFCTDITYLYYGGCRLAYLSVIKDIASKEVVSWELSNNISLGFVLKSVERLRDLDLKDSIIHSDQGGHYTSPEYIYRVKNLNLIQSMSRKGNCLDNAPIESFFGHLKDDVDCKSVKTFEELNDMIDGYMRYYNTKRYQWGIKKMTPVEYRNHLLVNA